LFRLTGGRDEACAQGFVACRESLRGSLECGGLEGAADTHGGGDVVGGDAARVELVEEPESRLGGGKLRGDIGRSAGDRRLFSGGGAGL